MQISSSSPKRNRYPRRASVTPTGRDEHPAQLELFPTVQNAIQHAAIIASQKDMSK